jgi:hypothetical protein
MDSSNSNNTKRGDPQQIPKEDVSGEIEKVISEQGGIEGEKGSKCRKLFKDCIFRTNIKGS